MTQIKIQVRALAMDGAERSVMAQMDAATLEKVVEIKKVFGAKSRVAGYKKPPDPLLFRKPE